LHPIAFSTFPPGFPAKGCASLNRLMVKPFSESDTPRPVFSSLRLLRVPLRVLAIINFPVSPYLSSPTGSDINPQTICSCHHPSTRKPSGGVISLLFYMSGSLLSSHLLCSTCKGLRGVLTGNAGHFSSTPAGAPQACLWGWTKFRSSRPTEYPTPTPLHLSPFYWGPLFENSLYTAPYLKCTLGYK